MILRRLKRHVASENWFAVGLDFAIVVLGVLIAFRITTLDEARTDREDYGRALERATDEARVNIDILDAVIDSQRVRLQEVQRGFEALRACRPGAESAALVEEALLGITGTRTIHIQLNALEELTDAPAMLAQQDRDTRRDLAQAKFNLDVLKVEADFAEALPFRDRPELSPSVAVGDLPEGADFPNAYHGIDLSRSYNRLRLAVPVEEACRDDALIKSMYTWIRFQSGIPTYAAQMRTQMETVIATAARAGKTP